MAAEPTLYILGFAGLFLTVRLVAGGLDQDRVRREISKEGGQVERFQWRPFGKGWLGDKSDRIYEVIYRDAKGARRRTLVKTSAFSGVYRSDDEEITPPAVGTLVEDENRSLRDEVRRLRDELDHAKGGH